MKREVNETELKKIQLDILQYVHDYCNKNNIYYSLAYGTLIGAVRHKGYIPWDDDIDICMPRPDYEKFLFGFNKYSSKYKVKAFEIDITWPYTFAKVIDAETILSERADIKYKMGINIDIFPIDGADDKILMKQIRLKRLLNLKVIRISKSRAFYKNMMLLIGKMFLLPFSLRRIVDKMCRIAKSISYETADYVSCTAFGSNSNPKVKKELFAERELMEFENKNFYVMKGYDAYLTSIYGDYMCFPPESEQVSHHDFIAYSMEKPH